MDTRGADFSIKAPTLLSGIIRQVNTQESTVDVKIDEPDGRYLIGCTYASPVQSSGVGGIDFAPVRGSSCIVLENLSNSSSGFDVGNFIVIGFRSRSLKSNLNRTTLNEGDIEVRSQQGNSVLLTRKGDIYIVADKQNYQAFLATEQLVRQRSSSYLHELAGGSFDWSVQADASGGPVSCTAEVKRYASDTEPYLTISAGTTANGGLDIVMHRPGEESSENASPLFNNLVHESAGFRFRVEEDGAVEMSALSMSLEAVEPISMTSKTSINMTSPGIVVNTAESSCTMRPGHPLRISAPRGIILDTPSIQIASSGKTLVESTNDENSKHLCTIDLLEWLFNHIHAVEANTVLVTPSITTCPLGTPDVSTDSINKARRDANLAVLIESGEGGDPSSEILSTEVARNILNFSVESLKDVCTIETKVK